MIAEQTTLLERHTAKTETSGRLSGKIPATTQALAQAAAHTLTRKK